MYCSTIITIKQTPSGYLLIELLAAVADKSTKDRQQPMVLHCCSHLETGCLKKYARYLAGQIELVNGP